MKPYYDQDGIQIFHADCRIILPTLPKVDLVLTDPPYGMNYHSRHYVGTNPHKPIAGDDEYPVWAIEQCRSIATSACMFFLRWDNLAEIPKPDSCVVWVKNNWTAGDLEHDYARTWEAVAVYNGPNHAFRNGRTSDVIAYDRVPPTSLLHPTEKPIGLLQKLIGHHVGDTVLDPFAGSGTTLVAAKLHGCRAIGCEISEDYCRIAVERLKQGVFAFDPVG